MMLSRSIFLEWDVWDKICRENRNTHFNLIKLFPENRAVVWENVEKCGKAGQATDNSMAHALCIPDN